MHSKRFTAQAAATLAAAALILSGCAAADDDPTSPGDGPAGEFKFGINFDLTNWNPMLAPNLTYIQLPYEGLVSLGADGFSVVPQLATEWVQEDDAITFTLRDDVTFHDGTPFTADSAIANIEHIIASGTEWSGGLSAIGEMTAVDDHTLRLELTGPNPSLLFNLASRGNVMISPAAIEAGTWEQEPVGTGPYILNEDETVPSSVYVFELNEDYYAIDEVGPARVEIHYIPDGAQRYNSVFTGLVDAARIDPAVVAEAESAGLATETWKVLRYHTFFFDAGEGGLFADPLIRQALCYAWPGEDIDQAQYEGTLEFPTQRLTEADPAYLPEIEAYPYDLDKARELLAEAGSPEISFTIPFPEGQEAAYSLIQESYNAAGFDVSLDPLSSPQYFSSYLTGQYPLVFNTSTSEDGGMYNYYKIRFAEDGGLNPLGVEPSAELAALFEGAITAGSDEEQIGYFKEMNSYISENALDCAFMDIPQTVAYNLDTVRSVQVAEWSPSAVVYKSVELVG